MNDKQFNTIMQVLAHITGRLDEHSAILQQHSIQLNNLGKDVAVLKHDVAILKQDVVEIRQDLAILRSIMNDGHETISVMHADVVDRCDKNHSNSDKRLRRLELKRA